MQIRQNQLKQQIIKKDFSIYWFAGQDNYLLNDSINTVKDYIKKKHECDEKPLHIQSAEDWQLFYEETSSYSLFSDSTLINVSYDKKTLDASGKKIITEYLKNQNSRCFILMRTPNIPMKQLQWLTPLPEVLLISHYSLSNEATVAWIKEQLRSQSLTFEPGVPELIQQYTQGNLLACAQLVEKIGLTYLHEQSVSLAQAQEQVYDQCDFSLYELIDACLLGQAEKCIHILRHAAHNKTEPTLIVWMLAQEIRLLLQLSYLIKTSDIKSACSQLKIWPQRMPLYHAAIKRIDPQLLERAHQWITLIDQQIKSNLNVYTWNHLERLVVVLSLNLASDELCIV